MGFRGSPEGESVALKVVAVESRAVSCAVAPEAISSMAAKIRRFLMSVALGSCERIYRYGFVLVQEIYVFSLCFTR